MTATIALPRQPHSEWMARIRTIGLALGGRGVMGLGLGRSSVGAAAVPWWLSGGVAAANCVAAYQSKGAASLAASYVNLANPGTYDAAPGVAPDWDSGTGWTFNGSTQYLTTGVTPPRDQTWSLLVRYSEPGWRVTDWETLTGSFSTSGGNSGFLVQGRNSGVSADYPGFWTGTASSDTGGLLPLTGVFGFAGKTSYLDGAADQTVSAGTATGNHLSLWVGGLNLNGALAQQVSGSIQAVAIYSATLSAAQVALISAAMAAL